jgi:DNA-binding NarL/FixJ family response regulator
LQPDILLMELFLRGARGFDVARTGAGAASTRIVILTGQPDPRHVQPLLRLGVSDYLSKGTSSLELLGALRAVGAGRLYVQPEFAALLWGGKTSAAPTAGLHHNEPAGKLSA